jgi:Protein of unknown function (DUF3995)
MRTSTRSMIRLSTGTTLLAAAATHVAWGRGSTFPYDSAADLADNVIGSPDAPSPAAGYAVASALAAAAVAVAVPVGGTWRRALLGATAVAFVVRAALGFAGRTDLLVAGSSSRAFRRNDRALFSPVCALLAVGVAVSARRAD